MSWPRQQTVMLLWNLWLFKRTVSKLILYLLFVLPLSEILSNTAAVKILIKFSVTAIILELEVIWQTVMDIDKLSSGTCGLWLFSCRLRKQVDFLSPTEKHSCMYCSMFQIRSNRYGSVSLTSAVTSENYSLALKICSLYVMYIWHFWDDNG